MRKSTLLVAAVVATIGIGLVTVPASVAGAVGATKLFVSPSADIALNNNHHSCATAGYNTISSAIAAAPAGSTIVVCAGTYNERLSIGTANLTLKASGIAIVRPTDATPNATSHSSAEPTVAVVQVTPGTTGVTINGLVIDGSGVASAIDGCSTEFAGVLLQATTGHNSSATLANATVENTTPTNVGCGSGQGVYASTDNTGSSTATLSVSGSTISGFGKTGILCDELGTSCLIKSNSITTAPSSLVAQNGVQLGFGAVGTVKENTISGVDWTAPDPGNPQPQGNYGAAVLLYAAGISKSGVASSSVSVTHNVLTNDQIGVEAVDTATSATNNTITETGAGIADSVGIYAVGCDEWCGYFSDVNGDLLNAVAASTQVVKVTNNTVNFGSTPSGSGGIWLGDDSWSADPGYGAFGPAGGEHVTVHNNAVSNAALLVTIGGGATI
jgi:hypothetical protein